MEEEYIKLEKIWRKFHSQNIEEGKMIRWCPMLKVVESNGGPNDTANYITVNTYNSIESYNSIWDNITLEKFTKLIRKRLRGKMSNKEIKKVLNAKIKKGHRSYMITPVDGTSPANLKIGDYILLDAMSQNSEDYEDYEKLFAKPIMQYNVDKGSLNLWGFTKIFDRNETAMKEPTHFTWRVPSDSKILIGVVPLYMVGSKFVYMTKCGNWL